MDLQSVFILSADQIVHILLHRTDSGDSEIIHKDLRNIRGKEGRKGWSEVDIFDSEGKKCQEHDHGFLLIPGDIVYDRKFIDIFQLKDFLEFQGNDCQGIGIVALSCIKDSRDSLISPRFSLLYLYFAQPAVRITVSFGKAFAKSV